ncbi:MAG: DMT family transporter [Myxococcota bacterium]|nr:DMT family transporter [Myxococcota bacterium]
MLWGLVLLVMASLCWATLDVQRKYLVQKMNPLTLTAALCFGQALLFLFAYGAVGFPIPDAGYWMYGVLCSLIALVAALGLNWALRLSPLSQCIPMLCLTPAFAVIHGYLLLGETLNIPQLVGLVFSAIGAAGFGLEKGWSRAKGAYMMMGVAFLFSLTMALDKVALQYAAVTAHALFQAALIAVLLSLVMVLLKQGGDARRVWDNKGLYSGAVLVFALAVGFQLEAVKYLDVSLLEALKRCIGLTSAVVAGYWLFKEPITSRKVASAALLAVGVCIVLLA